jgi:pyrroline-5-carboxylate reductase
MIIGFLGAGPMAQSLARGWWRAGHRIRPAHA